MDRNRQKQQETERDRPKLTEMDRNRQKRTETDRKGQGGVPKKTFKKKFKVGDTPHTSHKYCDLQTESA